jgi:hypothetical protein
LRWRGQHRAPPLRLFSNGRTGVRRTAYCPGWTACAMCGRITRGAGAAPRRFMEHQLGRPGVSRKDKYTPNAPFGCCFWTSSGCIMKRWRQARFGTAPRVNRPPPRVRFWRRRGQRHHPGQGRTSPQAPSVRWGCLARFGWRLIRPDLGPGQGRSRKRRLRPWVRHRSRTAWKNVAKTSTTERKIIATTSTTEGKIAATTSATTRTTRPDIPASRFHLPRSPAPRAVRRAEAAG